MRDNWGSTWNSDTVGLQSSVMKGRAGTTGVVKEAEGRMRFVVRCQCPGNKRAGVVMGEREKSFGRCSLLL